MRKMKRTSIFLIVLVFLATSCSLTKENKLYRSTINGTWQLTEVTYNGAKGNFTSTLFKDADAKCFEGSKWFFNANNSLGYYFLSQSQNCIAGKRDIRWSVYEKNNVQQLQFKLVNEKRKDINDYGFRLDIDYLDNEKMELHSDVRVEGEAVRVVYNFQKINQ